MQDIAIRPMKESEYPLLEEFLYQAIFVPQGQQPPVRSVLLKPELQVYIEGFGSQPHDHAFVADAGAGPVGAVWVRIMEDYGHVDRETPSFAISLLPAYRGKGQGARLMKAMLAHLREQGYKRASLAVQKANYAQKLYRAVGFKTVSENDEEYIMVCDLTV